MPFSHDILLGLNSCELIDIVYFDFAKAFDSVNHDIILYKLKNQLGIDGLMLKIIKEYLKGRNQRVVINGTLSSPLAVTSGVPQGSILGPLLFVLFINDMQTKVSEKTKIALYADDTKIWRRIRTPEDHHILQSDINALNEWASLNKMRFPPEKCKILSVNNFYRNLFQELPFYFFPYQLHSTILDYTPEEKDLGVLVTSKFSLKVPKLTYFIRQLLNLIFYDVLVILSTILENAVLYTFHSLEVYLATVPKYGALLVRLLSLSRPCKNAVLSGFTRKVSLTIMNANILIN